MSHAYKAVGWNRQKRLYDLVIAAGVVLYVGLFILASLLFRPNVTAETMLIRGLGSGALLLLHVVLSIGPLCRLDSRFLPLLYNRRHLGVTLFLVALLHGFLSLLQFHAFGDTNPLVSVLTSNGRYDSLAQFPFQPLGLAALLILFLMAATSHDFWLANLTPPTWKALHMLVYVAYGLIVLHVALGSLQAERNVVLALLLGLGLAWILTLHLFAARRERPVDDEPERSLDDGFVEVCRVDEIPEDLARIVTVSGERVAVFRYAGKVSALSNVCQHQNGPLGEGRIIDGCVTCPWHGFQYTPDAGASPPPFNEKVPTFDVRLDAGRVFLNPIPNPPGTRVEPARCAETVSRSSFEFYVGYLPKAPPRLAAFVRSTLLILGGGLAIVALLATLLQGPYSYSAYEFQNYRSFEGWLLERPHPMLSLARPGFTAEAEESSHYLLTVFGKHGAEGQTAGLDGHRVKLRGALVYVDGQTMLELEEGSIEVVETSGPPGDAVTLGAVTLSGEIVDSKCYLGTMKPAQWKPHRACATNCIAGGVPPLFVVQAADGSRSHYLLVDPDGEPLNDRVLSFVAEPVRISGEERRLGDLRILAADPARIERLE